MQKGLIEESKECKSAEEALNKDPNAQVQEIEQAWINEVDETLGEKIAETDIEFTVRDEEDNRLVRRGETNLADFTVDSYYWYIN